MSCCKQIHELITGNEWTSYGATPSTCIRPGVNFQAPNKKPPNDVIMLASTTLALACGDEKYLRNGRWCLTSGERVPLLKKMGMSGIGQEGGTLSKDDFKAFCKNHENKAWVLTTLPSSCHGLACGKLMYRAFDHFDANQNGVLDRHEFDDFMDFLGQLRLRYLQQMAFVAFRAYWGRGQPATDYGHGVNTQCHVRQLVDSLQNEMKQALEKNPKLRNEFQIGVLVKDWKGWFHDLVYYSANLHPLHGIWACCANNRLANSDRLMMEIAVLAYCFWMAAERDHMVREGTVPSMLENPKYFLWACVTIPSMILYQILYFCFTTPRCGTVDESSAKPRLIERAKLVSKCGDMIGNLLVVLLIGIACVRVFCVHSAVSEGLQMVVATVHARGLAYLTAWASYVVVHFNPFIAWGTTAPLGQWIDGEFKYTKPSYFGMLGDLIGLGQWTVEQRRVQLTTLVLPEDAVDLTTTISQSINTPANAGGLDELVATEAAFYAGENRLLEYL